MTAKGGDAPNIPDQTTTVQQSLPAYAEPFYRELLGRATYEASTPYQAFPGQRLADFNPAEMQAMQGIGQLGRPAQFDMASQMAMQGSQPGMYTPGYQAGTFDPGYQAGQANFSGIDALQGQVGGGPYTSGYTPSASLGPEFQPGTLADQSVLQSYMNPYQQLVTDIEAREARRQSDIMGSQIGQRAASQGSLGGYREAIMQAERERNLGQQLGDIQARGSQQAFTQAQQAFEADRARQLQASQLGLQRGTAQEGFQQAAEQFRQGAFGLGADVAGRLGQLEIAGFQAGEQARQRAAELGLNAQQQQEAARQAQEQFAQSGFGLNLDANRQQLAGAELLGNLGVRQQGLDLERLRSQQAAGQIQRELSQRGLDIGYQDFLRQQAFPREQLGMFSSLLQGLPIAPGSTTATFGNVPTAEQQLLGSGIAGVGLYNALRRGES